MDKEVRSQDRRIAYFSMEIGIRSTIPTYSGGLGVLAGDTLKAAADLSIPIVGVTLLSKQGYFTQHLDENGNQSESPTMWDIEGQLEELSARVQVKVAGREVAVRAFEHRIEGTSGGTVPVLFLDTDLAENAPEDRALTNSLYGGDQRYRLGQEIVLGIGGVRMLRALGYTELTRYHMNEGHAALLALELFLEDMEKTECSIDDHEACIAGSMADIRKLCVFTTHTPVAAGHDQFDYDLVREMLDDFVPLPLLQKLAGADKLNMTLLALNLSHYVNSVARQHQHVSSHLFPGYHFSSITNGVHSETWTSEPFQRLFDTLIPHWRQDSFDLRYALRIPLQEIWDAHQEAKRKLVHHVNTKHQAGFSETAFTIGFARRATEYKRADLIFHDIGRLRKMAQEHPLQLIFAGKAHPADTAGKDLIRKIHWHMGEIRDVVKVAYLPDYDMETALLLIPGVDVWLNTPLRPREASGTSGMKAAHNGVPQISIQDGWWMEGHIEGVTGWEIGPVPTEENEDKNDDEGDSQELYEKLEQVILPMYYEERKSWMRIMRNAIAFNASFFNTHRMMQQYVLNAYML